MNDVQPFDPNDELLADHQSPGLEAIKPNFDSAETPPPVLTKDSSSEFEESDEEGVVRPKRQRRGRRRGCQSEYGVISQLDQTRNDVAKHALKYALDSRTPSEVDQEEERERQNNGHHMVTDYQGPGPVSAVVVASNAASQHPNLSTADVDGNFDPLDMLRDGPQNSATLTNGFHKVVQHQDAKSLEPSAHLAPVQKQLDTRPPPLRSIPTETSGSNGSEDQFGATSPGLLKFKIGAANAAEPGNTLPAMQTSPGRPSSKGFAEHKTTLPSITTALNIDSAGSPFASHSPNLSRASPAHIAQYGPSPGTYSHPSPHSGMSPPAVPTHPSFYRTNTRDGSISTPSDHAITSATGSVSTPGSSIPTQSPAAYPTPTTATSETSQLPSQLNGVSHAAYPTSISQPTSPNDASHQPNGTLDAGAAMDDQNAPGSFKCIVHGCTALPFQTQYLLNSHMNVHSDTRPHFCNVKGCARGPGGQGFKRKNEMIRHGLVHTSPGYQCPFCPVSPNADGTPGNAQHKYPRPDNLQRHVRVHHTDRDRDDPQLREVLSQRPEGGTRGRRRRLGS